MTRATDGARLDLSRAQILAYRRHVGELDERAPLSPASLHRAAWAGLQDSVPRAALLSIHARVAGTEPSTWQHPSLVQLWGPRFSAYVVAEPDIAVFTLGRLPDEGAGLARAQQMAGRLDDFLDGRTMTYGEAGHAMGVNPNMLRYGAPTGRVLIRWDGARQPTVWTVPAPEMEPLEARKELARRYLHVFGPATPAAFAQWAGIKPPRGVVAFHALSDELIAVRTPIGDAWILTGDMPALQAAAAPAPAASTPARLLPSGDTYTLLHGPDRELLVPDPKQRAELWTPRVWPGAVLVDGEIVGTWRRANADVAIQSWRALQTAERTAVETEAVGLPLPGLVGRLRVSWEA